MLDLRRDCVEKGPVAAGVLGLLAELFLMMVLAGGSAASAGLLLARI